MLLQNNQNTQIPRFEDISTISSSTVIWITGLLICTGTSLIKMKTQRASTDYQMDKNREKNIHGECIQQHCRQQED